MRSHLGLAQQHHRAFPTLVPARDLLARGVEAVDRHAPATPLLGQPDDIGLSIVVGYRWAPLAALDLGQRRLPRELRVIWQPI